jgi:hypothetical protein
MGRKEKILGRITKNQLGIEIGPWFNPIAPKREGFNCLSLDLYNSETLMSRALADPGVPPNLPPLIEPVDIVGSSVDIGELSQAHGCKGRVDYIVSSHNLEHIPDPIRFLQGCCETLKLGGIVSLAIPDKRACFDHFRPHSSLGDWLEAYFENRSKPTLKQVFESHQLGALYEGSGAFHIGIDSSKITPTNNIRLGLEFWENQLSLGDKQYNDAHCWALTPALLELFMLDLGMLGLVQLSAQEISGPDGCEFYAVLRNMGADWKPYFTETEYLSRRTELIRIASCEQAKNSALFINTVGQARQDGTILELSKRLYELEQSTVWKVTGPIRRAMDALKRFVK